MQRARLMVVAVSLAGLALGATLAMAQRGPMGSGPGMMEPGMMGPGMMGAMGGGCPMMGMMMGRQDGPLFSEGRVAFLKAELAITAAQQAVWDAYAGAIKKNLASMQGMRQSMAAAMSGKAPIERLDAHVVAMEGRLAALKEVRPALEKLYAALGDDQKKKADELLTGVGCMM